MEEAANLDLRLRGRICYDVQGGAIEKAPFGRAGTLVVCQEMGRCWRRREVAIESPESSECSGEQGP